MQLSLNFLTPQPATPLSRLSPEQRTELIGVLARIIVKAANTAIIPPATTPPAASPEPVHD